jgi:hypothetical protein
VDDHLTKTEKKAWSNLKWTLDAGNEYVGGEPDEEDKKIESDKKEDPTPDTTPRTDLTPQRSDMLAKPEKKPTDIRKVLHSGRFMPRVGGAGGTKAPDEYKASKSMEQVV